MENVTNFILGAFGALGLIGLGYIFSAALSIRSEIKKIKSDLSLIREKLSETKRNLENSLRRESSFNSEEIKEINRRIDNLNSYVDSRLDKQSHLILTTITNTSKEINSKFDNLQKEYGYQINS